MTSSDKRALIRRLMRCTLADDGFELLSAVRDVYIGSYVDKSGVVIQFKCPYTAMIGHYCNRRVRL